MSVRSLVLPLVAGTVLLAGCGAGDGLRVENGSGPVSPTPVTTTETPSPTRTPSMGIMGTKEPPSKRSTTPTATPSRTPDPPGERLAVSRSVLLNARQLRSLLLQSPAVDADAKAVLATCPACLGRGVAADLIGSGSPQRIATVKVLNTGWTFVAYLVGDVGDVPQVRSVIRGQDMRFSVGKKRTLVVGSKVYGPTDRTCCPSGSKVELYHWNGNYLIKFSEAFVKSKGS